MKWPKWATSVNPVDAGTLQVMNLYPLKNLSNMISNKMMKMNILRIFYDYVEKRPEEPMNTSTVSLRSKLPQSNLLDSVPVTLHKPKPNQTPKIIKIIAIPSALIKSKSMKSLWKFLIQNPIMIKKSLKNWPNPKIQEKVAILSSISFMIWFIRLNKAKPLATQNFITNMTIPKRLKSRMYLLQSLLLNLPKLCMNMRQVKTTNLSDK